MNSNQICLAPYKVQSPSFPGSTGPAFVDNKKTRLVAVVSPSDSPKQPESDAVLLQEKKDDINNSMIRWYECPSTKGRVYTVEISACEVFITYFENGFLKNGECDARELGSQSFCFGKAYDESDQVFETENPCSVSFTFDGHLFSVQGTKSESVDLFDCVGCWPRDEDHTVIAFGGPPPPGGGNDGGDGGDGEAPETPGEPGSEGGSSGGGSDDELLEGTPVEPEDRTIWNTPSGWEEQGLDVTCGSTTTLAKGECESHDNPDVAILQSGQSIIAYAKRAEDGTTIISLALVDTSVQNKIVYYRSLSKGTLLNSEDFAFSAFEVFDDLVVDPSTASIGFLNGPLKGQAPSLVSSITRTTNAAGRPMNLIEFNPGREAVFPDSNHVSNVSWFLIDGTSGSPGGFSLLDLPSHTYQGSQVPVAYPAVTVAKNNLMTGSDQHIFVAYQAFENQTWKIYMRHIILSDFSDTDPTYSAPYIFEYPTTTPSGVTQDGVAPLVYTVKEVTSNAGIVCAIFDVKLETGYQVTNCDATATTFTTSCGFVVDGTGDLSPTNAYLEAQFDLAACGPSVPSWSVGSEFTGGVLPTADEIGWLGDSSCITSINAYPSASEWCYPSPTCTQYFMLNDPYCPDAYIDIIDVRYNPEDLYLMEDNDQIVSRVKYHLSASVVDTEEAGAADIMFVVDYSSSMGTPIENVRNAIPLLAQQLNQKGIDARFGLTVYGALGSISGYPAIIPNQKFRCNGDGAIGNYIFNGMQSHNECDPGCSEPFAGDTDGFTRSVDTLTQALCCWTVQGGLEPHWVAIQFASGILPEGETDTIFDWREDARRFIILVTDEPPNETVNAPPAGACLGYNNSKDDAIAALLANNMIFVPIVASAFSDNYSDIPAQTGWGGSSWFNIQSESYDDIFSEIAASIEFITSGLRIVERDDGGYAASFMKNAEVLITYQGDLSDIWTYDKDQLEFTDQPPVLPGDNKGVSNFPFSLYSSHIYGIDPVQPLGNVDKWIYYKEPGQLRLEYPNIGFVGPKRTDPILISSNGTKPKVLVNNRNDVFVAYQSYELGYPQIEIRGTGDFHQNSITGPKARRMTRLVAASDFIFTHDVTLPDDQLNQLSDLVIDNSDITHITWQSNQDSRWEIYYANSYDGFLPIKVTESDSRSGFPQIDVDVSGNIFIVYQDNRFGPYEVMLSFKEESRVLPLLEQDAYMASMRAEYEHYTNILPVLLRNTVVVTPLEGVLVLSKIASLDGNGDENFVFILNDDLEPTGGGSTVYEILAMAGNTDGYLYGITADKLLLMDEPESENPYLDVEINEIQEIGDLLFTIPVAGEIKIEESFGYSDSTAFPTSGWTQQPVQWPGLVTTASGIICSGAMNICGQCPSPLSGSSRFRGIYIHDTRLVTGERNISIRARIRWDWAASQPDASGDFFFDCIFRGQPRISGYPGPCYAAGPFYRSSTDTMMVGVARYSATGSLTTIGGCDIPLGEDHFRNRWCDLQVDCFDGTSPLGNPSVLFRIFLDGVLVCTTYDESGSRILSDSSSAFSYGFVDTCGIIGSEHPHFRINSFSLETLSTTLASVTTLDAAHDHANKLWLLTHDVTTSGISSQRLIEINKTDATSLMAGTIRSDIDRAAGGVAILLDGTFFVVTYQDGNVVLQRSSYPVLSTTAQFSFSVVTESLSANIIALTSDHEDALYGLDENNILYQIDQTSGVLTQLSDLTTDPYLNDPYTYETHAHPIARLSGLAYLFTGNYDRTGDAGFFHIMIEFYNNINLQGEPALVIDSRDNLEAFLTQGAIDDPYFEEDAYFEGARGIYLAENQTAFAFFDASHDRPGQTALSYPYSFATNQTYFPRTFIVNEAGSLTLSTVTTSSFSCNKCSTLGDNIFDSHGCSFTFSATNTDDTNATYKFVVDFFADRTRLHLIQRYTIDSTSDNLDLMEINNEPASQHANVTEDGVYIAIGQAPVIQIYPALDPNTGIICGVDYTMAVYVCENNDCTELNREPSGLTINANTTFRCECSSNIFSDTLIALSQVGRWSSSAHGASDTRVTDSQNNAMRPTIKTRSTGAAIIAFEDYNDSDVKVKGATFRETNQDQLFGSGTRAWFNYDLETIGRDIALTTDLYDRAVTAFEVPDEQAGRGLSSNELPGTTIAVRNCDFEEPEEEGTAQEPCDIDQITSNIISSDPFVASSLVKKILLTPVQRYTYSSDGETTPVVNVCDVVLQIWGTPEVVALRFKNEDQDTYSQWCPFSPELSDYYIEKPWKLSTGVGIKEICMQAMTYSGVTAQFCAPVIGDYDRVSYQIKLYIDDSYTEELPTYEGLFVASTRNLETGLSQTSRTIWVQIIPNLETPGDAINFDVVQQGEEDLLNLVADKFIDNGRLTYRGNFSVKIEDNIFNIDGLAQIRAKFPGECEEFSSLVSSSDAFVRDKFNVVTEGLSGQREDPSDETTDPLVNYRQQGSGDVGVPLVIRPTSDDPFLIFGDPSFYTKVETPDPDEQGVPQDNEPEN